MLTLQQQVGLHGTEACAVRDKQSFVPEGAGDHILPCLGFG